MDVAQIQIKITQTNRLDEGKPKSTSQTEDSVNSFDQILAMFNFGGNSPKSDSLTGLSSVQNGSVKEKGDQIDSTNINKEDWLQLDAILTSLLAVIQQVQVPNVQANESLPPGDSTMLSPQQLITADVRSSFAQWFPEEEGFNQTTTINTSQLIQGLAQLMSELSSLEKQKSLEIPSNIKDKLQMILDEIKTENNIDGTTLHNVQLQKNELFSGEKKQDPGIVKPWLSLDKNKVMLSFGPNPGTSIQESSNLVRDPLSKQVEDLTRFNGLTIMGNHQLQAPEDSIVPKTVSPSPLLQVSEFAPEVSEWISRNMRITNGQPGSTEVKFSLFPEHLGHIEIKISSQQGLVSAQILTDTLMAKEALEGQLQQLRQSLLQQGVVVQKLDIVQQTPVSNDLNHANLSFSQGGSSSSQEQRTFNSKQDESKIQMDDDQTEIEKETLAITYGGAAPKTASSIDFTA
ncbi:flagellar hook-length control protein FliK [Neobacillus sp.]|uniref:flagellar hook-length control protein FliK n=1 Tax=Neobacillus sp. TaxID=2675273 RepID=UPI00289DECFC|nr:flagellar hook-length control protein FliK [Neobacillus sp.]